MTEEGKPKQEGEKGGEPSKEGRITKLFTTLSEKVFGGDRRDNRAVPSPAPEPQRELRPHEIEAQRIKQNVQNEITSGLGGETFGAKSDQDKLTIMWRATRAAETSSDKIEDSPFEISDNEVRLKPGTKNEDIDKLMNGQGLEIATNTLGGKVAEVSVKPKNMAPERVEPMKKEDRPATMDGVVALRKEIEQAERSYQLPNSDKIIDIEPRSYVTGKQGVDINGESHGYLQASSQENEYTNQRFGENKRAGQRVLNMPDKSYSLMLDYGDGSTPDQLPSVSIVRPKPQEE